MSDTIKELWDAFKGQLKDRLANPFTGALAIAWCLINFRLLVVLVWIEPYQQKFTYIDTVLYPSMWYWGIRAVAAPVIAAYAYLLFYPKLTMWAATRYRRMQSQANNEMRAAQGEALMTQEEYRNARTQLARIESQVRADIAEGADRVKRQDDLIELQRTQLREHKERADRLERQLAAINVEPAKKKLADLGYTAPTAQRVGDVIDALKAHPPGPANPFVYPAADANADNSSTEVGAQVPGPKGALSVKASAPTLEEVVSSETKMSLLKQLAIYDGGKEIEELASLSQRSTTATRHHLEVMADLGLVDQTRGDRDEWLWYLTRDGRAFAVQHRLVEP